MIVASALERQESRGSHYRSDYPATDNSRYLQNVYLQRDGEGLHLWWEPVQCTRLQPPTSAGAALGQAYVAQEGE
jgi:succinate dehydrogenase/fumarate reductase flavoprotein subunit